MLRTGMLSMALAAVAWGRVHAQQDGLVAFPNVYRVQFENDWVRLVRVSLPVGNLAPHTHPPGVMLHIYFNDAEPVMFRHDGAPYDVTRPAVKARSYRIGRATPETHEVINAFGGASDYMRVELKTQGDESLRRRVAAPPLANQTDSVVEVTNPQYRATRVTIAAGTTFTFATNATEPALLIALTTGAIADSAGVSKPLNVGDERFIATGRRDVLRNAGSAPVQFLRVDFLTRPY